MSKLVFALALAAAAFLTGPAARAEAPFQPERFSVEVRGKGPDVILIPGLASSRDVWNGTAAQLERSRRLHLVQVAGFAGLPAGPNASGPVIAPLVEELHRYIVAQGLKRPAIIGHSMGGLVGLMLAKAHPEDVGRLMVVEALPFFGLAFSPDMTADSAAPLATQARALMQAMTPEAYAAAQTQGAARYSKTPAGQALVKAWAIASDQIVVGQATYDDLTTDVRPDLPAITAPVTVLFAWDETMGSVERVSLLYLLGYTALPNKRIERIDGSYHFIPLDQPELFAAAVKRFLD